MVHLFMAKLFFYEGAPEGGMGGYSPLSWNPSPTVGENLTIRRGSEKSQFLKFCTFQDITFVNPNTDFDKIKSKDFLLISTLNLFVHYSKMYRFIFFKIWQENDQNTTH